MHPLFVSPRRLGAYLIGWLPFSIPFIVLLHEGGADDWAPLVAVSVAAAWTCALIALAAYYTCRAVPLGTTPAWKTLLTQGAAALLSTALWLLIAAALLRGFERIAGPPGAADPVVAVLPVLGGVALVAFLLSVALHYLWITFERSRDAERRALELQVVAREAELKTLRAQIDPHFLFNSLHSISALTLVDPAAARQMCVRLGDFLRTTLKVGQRPFITLGDELALVRAYLGIEQVRLGARLRVSESIERGLEASLLPPLLLHPLVENAVTHGIGQLVEGGRIELRVKTEGGSLRITVGNSCDPDRERRRGTGMGLENVRRRLSTVYEREAGLGVREQPDWFEVDIALPHRTAASPGDAHPAPPQEAEVRA